MRATWVGTSWKMNKTLAEATAFARQLRAGLPPAPGVQVFVVPPFTALAAVSRELLASPIWVGAQNMHWEDEGAFTGEISPLMVRDAGARLVELGHSERRAHFGETDETVNRKVLSALRHGLRPLICVGENAAEKEAGAAAEVTARQVKLALRGVTPEQAGQVLLAYEPVWAIGAYGTPADPCYANLVQAAIRAAAAQVIGETAAASLPVLYGGSVNHENAAELLVQPEVDGLFIGRAAWKPAGFLQILNRVLELNSSKLSSSGVECAACQ